MKKQELYWKEQFAGDIPLLKLPIDYERPAIKSFEGDKMNFEIAAEETAAIKEWALEEDLTPFMLLLAVFYVLLAKITGQEDIVVGTGAVGRSHPDLESIIGMFVNLLALRNYPGGERHFNDFLEEVKGRTLDAFENQDYQFDDLVEQVLETREPGRSPLFDVVFSLHNPESPEAELPGLKLKPYRFDKQLSKFDMTIVAVEAEEKLHFIVEYSTEIFRQDTIARFTGYFKEILSAVLADRNIKLKDIEISHEYEDSDSNPFQVDFGFLETDFNA